MKSSAFVTLLSAALGASVPTEQSVNPAKKAFFGGPVDKEKHVEVAGDSVQMTWAGSVQSKNGWKTVTGTTRIPKVSGQGHSAGAAAWVGIDG